MNNFFFSKLALNNLKKNKSNYFPYILSACFTICLFFSFYSLAKNPALLSIKGSSSVRIVLSFGLIVIAIFSVILLSYTNGFLFKQRQKELGLYNVLGMEKKHIKKIFFFESLYIALISIFLGIGIGLIFNYLLYLILLKMIRQTDAFLFYFDWKIFFITIAFFLTIFFIILLCNNFAIKKAKTLDLLKTKNMGEKEPKHSWFLTLLGIITLSLGYYISLTVDNPLSALSRFFLAVILVIIASYCLFMAGSISFLKLLKKNKKIYYQPRNFISISSLIFRMKQNALGLATITILASMVIVTFGSTASLFLGINQTIDRLIPRDVVLEYSLTDDAYIQDKLKINLDKYGLQPKNEDYFRHLSLTGEITADQELKIDRSALNNFKVIPLSDLPDEFRKDISLGDREIFIFQLAKNKKFADKLIFNEEEFFIKGKEKLPRALNPIIAMDDYLIVVKDLDSLSRLKDLQSEDPYLKINVTHQFDLNKDIAEEDFRTDLNLEGVPYSIGFRGLSSADIYMFYGGFFFIGIFLSLLFTMATALIIYYKQISEGYEDRLRFQILRKVGMSESEIKATIKTQIRIMFFLPILASLLHTIFAFNIVNQIIMVFGINNARLVFLTLMFAVFLFTCFYFLIYKLTAKTYYRLLEIK